MKPGDVILVPLPQADGQRKRRPAIVLRSFPPFGDWLVCGISTQLPQQVTGLDERITNLDDDFSSSSLRSESLIRLGYLAEYAADEVIGTIGHISSARLSRLLNRLSACLLPHPTQIRKIIGIIPARFASTRFPGKPLALIAGKSLIQRVVEQCQRAKSLSEIVVATDDERIFTAAKKFCRVEMTRADHPSGSDRIAEVAERIPCDAVVNIQGDEPLIDPAVIDVVANALADCEMSTAATPIRNPAEYDNPNVVKVVANAAGRALYFSRRTIPYLREAATRPAHGASGGVSVFKTSRHLRLPARDAAALGEVSRCRRLKMWKSSNSCARWITESRLPW